MKTKLFYLIAVIALFFTACTPEEKENVQAGSTLIINSSSEIPTGDWVDRGVDIDYHVKINVNFSGGKVVNVEPGVTIEFEGTSAGFTISGSSVLKMIGTATKPIILKGQNAVKGNWKGIVLESADPNNIWEYVTISDAGSSKASIYMNGSALKPSLNNCSIQNSGGYGIYLNNNNIEFLAFNSNSVANCTNAPMYLYPQSIFSLGINNTFKNNTYAYIQVSNNTLTTPTVWNKMDVPYRVGEIISKSKLEIKPGVVIEINPEGAFYIGDQVVEGVNGILVANGTANEPIIFKGTTDNVKGLWTGIVLNTPNVENSMNYCQIIGAGSSNGSCGNYKAALKIGRGKYCTDIKSRGSYQNITIQNSGGYGVAYRISDAPTVNGFQYANNTLANVFNF